MREAGPGMWFLEGHEGPSMDSCLTLALVVSLCDCAGWCLGFCGAGEPFCISGLRLLVSGRHLVCVVGLCVL